MKRPIGLLIAILLILALGLSTIYSTESRLFPSQLSFILAGSLISVLLARLDIDLIKTFSPLVYFAGLLLLTLTFLIGRSIRGTTGWLELGDYNLQTSEVIKPLVILFVADQMSRADRSLVSFLKLLFVSLLPLILILMQPDLGSTLVLAGALFFVWLGGPVDKKVIALAVGLGILMLPVTYNLLADYQRQRIDSFLNPYLDPTGSGYQVIQSTIAIGSGQLLGKGVRQGTQSQLQFLPERHTDFAFASYAEEFGFVGVSLLIGAYGLLFWSLLNLVEHSTGSSRLINLGFFGYLFVQTSINLGMNLGISPVTGVTLPFFSYGGSSLISLALSLGILVSLNRQLLNNKIWDKI